MELTTLETQGTITLYTAVSGLPPFFMLGGQHVTQVYYGAWVEVEHRGMTQPVSQ